MTRQRNAGRLIVRRDAPRLTWLAARRSMICGSDIAAVMYDPANWPDDQRPPWGDRYTVWADKTGRTPLDRPPTVDQRRGQLMEPVIFQMWREEPEWSGARFTRTGLWQSKTEPRAGVTPDYLCGGCAWGDRGTVNIKSQRMAAEWGDQWNPRIPIPFVWSEQWAMFVLGYDHSHLPVLGPSYTPFHRIMFRDQPLIEQLLKTGMTFWEDCVVTNDPPEATRAAMDLLGRSWPNPVKSVYRLTEAEAEMLRRAAKHDLLMNRHKNRRDDAIAAIKARAGAATEILWPDSMEVAATWAPSVVIDGADADWQAAHKELSAAYAKVVPTTVIDTGRLVAEHGMIDGLRHRRTFLIKNKRGPR